ncbi:MAG: hypothetical protein AB7I19_16845 [Planctomycetota bacterium]
MSQHTKYRDPHQGYRRVSEKRRAQRVIEDALALARAEATDDLDDRTGDEPGGGGDLVSLMATQTADSKPARASVSPQSAGNPTGLAGEGRMIETRGATTRVVRGVMAGGHQETDGRGDAVDRLLASIRRHR